MNDQIFVVTKNSEVYELFEDRIKQFECDFFFVGSQSEAISFFENFRPLFVIIEISAEDLGTKLRRFKEDNIRFRHTPFLFICEQHLRPDKILRILERVDDYLIRPVRDEELETHVINMIRRQKKIDKHSGLFRLNHEELLFNEVTKRLNEIFINVRNSQHVDLFGVQKLAKKLVNKTLQGDYFQLMALTNNVKSSIVMTAIRVATFAILVGRSIRYSLDDLQELGIAALLHDIGYLRLPQDIMTQYKTSQNQQIPVIQRHPLLGFELINEATAVHGIEGFERVAQTVCQTHEREGGGGFPHGLAGDDIQEFAKIIGLSETFVAFIDEHQTGKSANTFNALQKIICLADRHFPANLKRALIRSISIYPLGTFVKLNTGEKGKVVKTNPANPTRPIVELLYDSESKPYIFPIRKNLVDHPFSFITHIVAEDSLPIVDKVFTL